MGQLVLKMLFDIYQTLHYKIDNFIFNTAILWKMPLMMHYFHYYFHMCFQVSRC